MSAKAAIIAMTEHIRRYCIVTSQYLLLRSLKSDFCCSGTGVAVPGKSAKVDIRRTFSSPAVPFEDLCEGGRMGIEWLCACAAKVARGHGVVGEI